MDTEHYCLATLEMVWLSSVMLVRSEIVWETIECAGGPPYRRTSSCRFVGGSARDHCGYGEPGTLGSGLRSVPSYQVRRYLVEWHICVSPFSEGPSCSDNGRQDARWIMAILAAHLLVGSSEMIYWNHFVSRGSFESDRDGLVLWFTSVTDHDGCSVLVSGFIVGFTIVFLVVDNVRSRAIPDVEFLICL